MNFIPNQFELKVFTPLYLLVLSSFLVLCSFAAMGSLSVQGSYYPAGYFYGPSCITNGPVQVCRDYQPLYKAAVLSISYQGSLMNSSGLSVWIKVNYKEGSRQAVFPMSLINGGTLGYLKITGGCLVPQGNECAQRGTAEMGHLLFWAQRINGTLNALNLDIALVDDKENWDNNGQAMGSYRFDFIQE